jgi:hypothetical protein
LQNTGEIPPTPLKKGAFEKVATSLVAMKIEQGYLIVPETVRRSPQKMELLGSSNVYKFYILIAYFESILRELKA